MYHMKQFLFSLLDYIMNTLEMILIFVYLLVCFPIIGMDYFLSHERFIEHVRRENHIFAQFSLLKLKNEEDRELISNKIEELQGESLRSNTKNHIIKTLILSLLFWGFIIYIIIQCN